MRIGCLKEIKPQEYRVGLSPAAVHELIAHGHEVMIETEAGGGAGFEDTDYRDAGATIIADARTVYDRAELVVKVKEPQKAERGMLREGQVLFTYLHLAPDEEQTRDLVVSGVTAVAYETVTDREGGLPLLAPMSEVAGRLAPQVGSWALQKANGGRGVLLGGVPGVRPTRVLIVGGGVVGLAAARVAVGMGANVTVLDRSLRRLSYLDDVFMGSLTTQYSNIAALNEMLPMVDLVIGAVLIPGAAAPKLVTREHLGSMIPGSVLVDVAVDQGGCFETTHATTHQNPTYEIDGIIHYCVGNMPGAVPRTATQALGNATLPFILQLADKGWREAMIANPHLRAGLSIHQGKVVSAPVAEAHGMEAVTAESVLGIN